MASIFALTLPIYLLMALGYACVRFEVFEKSDMRTFAKLVMQICLPALLFRSLSQKPLAAIFDAMYLLAYGGGSLIAMAIGQWVARRYFAKSPQQAAVFGLGVSTSNSGFMGYPIVMALLGADAAVPVALTLVAENMVLLPLSIALIGARANDQASRWQVMSEVMHRLIRNPVVMSIPFGVMFAAFEWRLPAPIDKPIQLLSAVASPVALFVIGGILYGLQIKGGRKSMAYVAGSKLLIHPAIVGCLVWLLPDMTPIMCVTAITLAAMPMLSIYPVLAHPQGMEGFCAAVLLVATTTSFLTISAWLWLMHQVPDWQPAWPHLHGG